MHFRFGEDDLSHQCAAPLPDQNPVHDPADIGQASAALGIFGRALAAIGLLGRHYFFQYRRAAVGQHVQDNILRRVMKTEADQFFGHTITPASLITICCTRA
jgi:hypothetical protein